MNNKTEMVSVPRELLDVLRFWLERAAEKSEADDFKELIQLRELLRAAPAEDVRAVVDEPVAWEHKMLQESGYLKELTDDPKHPFGVADVDYDASFAVVSEPLYHHPERPLVLPERREPSPSNPYLSDADIEWNACLDEFARLNPNL